MSLSQLADTWWGMNVGLHVVVAGFSLISSIGIRFHVDTWSALRTCVCVVIGIWMHIKTGIT